MVRFGHPWGRQRHLNTHAMCATPMWKCTPFFSGVLAFPPASQAKELPEGAKALGNQPINQSCHLRQEGHSRPTARHPPSRHLTKGVSATSSPYRQQSHNLRSAVVLWRAHLFKEPVLRPGGVNLQSQPPAPLPASVCYAAHLCSTQRVNRPSRCPLCRSLFPSDPPPGALAPACATQSP